ncbi:MAG: hypothetical protein NTW62_02805 [Candidatus Nomurabacteria bacterium]|nr:hypothetical protein [Candidatus Nomurabacteria bacterium]
MKTNSSQKNKLPRSIHMRMILGDEQYEYIKDEVGVENFLKQQFDNYYTEQEDIIDNQDVKNFFVFWILIVSYYKFKFGKGIRDKDAVGKLKSLKGFEKIEDLYAFRNNLFKFDFNYNDPFKKELKANVSKLKKIVAIINKERKKRDQRLIENKEW